VKAHAQSTVATGGFRSFRWVVCAWFWVSVSPLSAQQLDTEEFFTERANLGPGWSPVFFDDFVRFDSEENVITDLTPLDGTAPNYSYGGHTATWTSGWLINGEPRTPDDWETPDEVYARGGAGGLIATSRIPVSIEPGHKYMALLHYNHFIVYPPGDPDDVEYYGIGRIALAFTGDPCANGVTHPLGLCGNNHAQFSLSRIGFTVFDHWTLDSWVGSPSGDNHAMGIPENAVIHLDTDDLDPSGEAGLVTNPARLMLELDTTSDPWIVRNYVDLLWIAPDFSAFEVRRTQVGQDAILTTSSGAHPATNWLAIEVTDGAYTIDSLSFFKWSPPIPVPATFVNHDPVADTATISFPSSDNETYLIEASPNLIDWQPIEESLPGEAGQSSTSYTETGAHDSRRFFRVSRNP
jgi:hypothetical protein